MRRFPSLHRLSHKAAGLALGLVVAAGMALVVGQASSRPAAADGLQAPTLISVRIESPSTAFVTFLDPNTDEEQYDIWMLPQSINGRGFQIAGPGVPGSGRQATRTVEGLTPGVSYCFVVDALSSSDRSADSNKLCADPPAATPPPASSPSPSPLDARAGDPCVVCASGVTVIGKPSNFSGQRITRGTNSVVLLTWDPSSAVSFYQLRAVSHQDGKTPLDVGVGAGDIGAANDTVTINGQPVTGFIGDGTAASVPGGADYYIKGCSAPGQCGGEAMIFVPGP